MQDRLKRDAVLRVGEVTEVFGQSVVVRVDRNKNASDLLFDGDVLKNISVNSFVEIRKGFTSLIGKVDGERLDDITSRNQSPLLKTDKNRRFLQVSLAGFIEPNGKFRGGLRELPLIGNEVYIVTKELIEKIHNLVDEGRPSVKFAVTDAEGFDIAFPIDSLFNGHIAIFGNTGSGKSNTLARLYSAFVKTMKERNRAAYERNVRILLLDFNGEYGGNECITTEKKVYRLSTGVAVGDRLPMPEGVLTDLEMLAILSDATDKTQKPFLRRALDQYLYVFGANVNDPLPYFRAILERCVSDTLRLSDKQRADLLLDYLRNVLPARDARGDQIDVREGLEWHGVQSGFKRQGPGNVFYRDQPLEIRNTTVHRLCQRYEFEPDLLARLVTFIYVQLIQDVLTNRAQNEHIAPLIGRLKARQSSISKIFDTSGAREFWDGNFVVVSLDRVSLDMRKMLPLLLAKKVYQDHKEHRNTKTLTIIIDEAHNILSTESFREEESWKDYRLETFEEIIKEGRKFGVFVTISSQRPNDISPTITSQAHNYFIHRLINQRDLATISSAVSYIDKISEGSIPTLPIGTCIFSGVAGQMPLKLRVRPLALSEQPRSSTQTFDALVPQVRRAADED